MTSLGEDIIREMKKFHRMDEKANKHPDNQGISMVTSIWAFSSWSPTLISPHGINTSYIFKGGRRFFFHSFVVLCLSCTLFVCFCLLCVADDFLRFFFSNGRMGAKSFNIDSITEVLTLEQAQYVRCNNNEHITYRKYDEWGCLAVMATVQSHCQFIDKNENENVNHFSLLPRYIPLYASQIGNEVKVLILFFTQIKVHYFGLLHT